MFDAIQIFLEVHEAGSLSAVAKKHNVAVSSISRKIDALESELGIKLFHRSSRRLLLTDSGEQFLPRAKNIAAELDDARQAMSDLNGDPRGLLTVTAPSAFGRRHVAPAVASFLNRYPLMEVDLHVSDEIVDLSTRRVDVAVRIGVLPDSDLVASTLAPLHRLTLYQPGLSGAPWQAGDAARFAQARLPDDRDTADTRRLVVLPLREPGDEPAGTRQPAF